MPALPPLFSIAKQVSLALEEDIGFCDWTANLIDHKAEGQAQIVSKAHAILCGTAWANEAFRQVNPDCQITWLKNDGDAISPKETLCKIQGPARALLTAERTALNFLQTLSAVATTAQHYQSLIGDLPTQILDTRKTLPGLRLAQKYAVTVGGGHNQRLALYDGILIKENHIAAAGSIQQALKNAQTSAPHYVSIQIEVETLDQLEEAIQSGANLVLLDNMTLEEMRQAVQIAKGKAILEASGGVDEDSILAIAQTGVDRISIGKLTKDIEAIDLSMRFC